MSIVRRNSIKRGSEQTTKSINVEMDIQEETSVDIEETPLFASGIKLLGLEHFKKDFGCFPCIERYTIYDFSTIYSTIKNLNTLDTYQKNILLVRFNRICTFIKNKYSSIQFYYTMSKIYVIVTGIVNPALLSINVQTDTFWYDYIYWLVWILQIMVSLVTALSSFYKWDKKYFTYKAYKIKIEQELWLYLELIGRYSRINEDCPKEKALGYTTHETKINLFLFRLEYLFKRLKDADLDIEITEDESSRDNKAAINNKSAPSSGNTNPTDEAELESFATASMLETDIPLVRTTSTERKNSTGHGTPDLFSTTAPPPETIPPPTTTSPEDTTNDVEDESNDTKGADEKPKVV